VEELVTDGATRMNGAVAAKSWFEHINMRGREFDAAPLRAG
jgi:hypothetical protein